MNCRRTAIARALGVIILLTLSASAQTPTFSKAFSPSTIGPGNVSTLTFTITNDTGAPLTELAFTDVLPAGVSIANPTLTSSTCGGTLSAPDGGTTINFTDGVLASGSCTIAVDVTASAAGTYANVSGDLTSSAGTYGPASADLTVDNGRIGFSKSFSPSTVQYGGRSTLTFTLDNTSNPSIEYNAQFTDNLPAGLVVAGPANSSTTCSNAAVTAVPGSSTITFGPTGTMTLAAGATCTASVDVEVLAIGTVVNTASLTYLDSSTFSNTAAGKANAAVVGTGDDLILDKSFTDDPAGPGDTVNLQFTILNRSRSETASNIGFSDDLDATLSGLVAVAPLPVDPCGTGSTLSGTGVLTLAGASLAPESSCTFDVSLQIPAMASTGSYPNTTSQLTGDLGGVPSVYSPASDVLFVLPAPVLTKTFVESTAVGGDTLTIDFQITNASSTDSATNISFSDNISQFASGTTISSLPAAGFCGAGSTAAQTIVADERIVLVNNASLAPSASCTFSVTVTLPAGIRNGTYTNTTSQISATIAGDPVMGAAASDSVDVVAAPRISKSFADPVDPGALTTLEFTITHDLDASTDATGITFTDDLDATLTGLVATGLPLNDVCGTGSQINGTNLLTLTDGTLAPGESCTFSVDVQVPAGATPGSYPNTTSTLDATVSGLAVSGPPATDNLDINGLTVAKTFTDDPAVAGGTVNLRFTIANAHPTDDATGIGFTDDLDAMLPGLVATGTPIADACGAGSTLSGAGVLTLSNGNLAAGTSCTVDVTLQLPADAQPGEYINTTSAVTATLGITPVVAPAATDRLLVASPLTGSKSFIDDPVAPGDPVTLRFTLENTSPTAAVTAIGFTDDLGAVVPGMVASSLPAAGFCGAGSTISGTNEITVSGANLAAGASCTFDVILTVPPTAIPGIYTNETSQVAAVVGGNAFNIAGLTDSVLVSQAVAITKSFTDDPVERGGTATLQFTLTNPDPTNAALNVSFTDDLGAVITGLVAVGLPQNDVCGAGSTLSGTSTITLSGGTIAAGGSCVISVPVQVPAMAPLGAATNTTSGVTATIGGRTETGLPGSDDITVVDAPTLTKLFTNDPVEAGDTVSLQFTLTLDPLAPADATAITFSDDLDATLAGLVATGLPQNNVCGTGSTLSGTSTITLADGVIAPGGSCTFSVTLQVPAGADPGDHTNTTSPVDATMLGTAVSEPAASDVLSIVVAPVLTKSFIDDPVEPGDTATLRFTLTLDPLAPAGASGITFTDDLGATLTGLVATGLPLNDVCGPGSQITGTSVLTLTGGNLAVGGSCTFDVPLQLPAGATPGVHTNTTSAVTATMLATTVTGLPASDDLIVVVSPVLTKTFTDDPVDAGDPVTLELTLTLDAAAPADATGITFTDDLDATLAGLVATGLPAADVCGAGSQLSGTSTLTLTGGTLSPGGSCTFSVTLQTPAAAAAGNYLNTTSAVTATMNGVAVTGAPATDTLIINGLILTKTFTDDPAIPGGTMTLEFTLTNGNPVSDATNINFTDDLDAAAAGLVAEGLPVNDVCGAGSQLSGTNLLTFSGGTVAGGGTCTFSVTLRVDGSTMPGIYTNTTSGVTADIGGFPAATAPAADDFEVVTPLEITKIFTDDPVQGGGTATLEFTLTNSSPTVAATGVTFTDDLGAVLAGLVATGLPASDVCGVGSQLTGTSLLTLTGGTIPAASSCTFAVTLDVPATPGTYTNTTSLLSGDLGGTTMTSLAGATDDLTVTIAPVVSKTFIGDPVEVGDVVTLEFTISLSAGAPAGASAISFTDDLDGILPGLAATGLPANDVCGAGSQLSGTGLLTLAGGSLAPGGSCTFSATVQVPAGAVPGQYTNVTSALTATMAGTGVTGNVASDGLFIAAAPAFTKSFIDDPAIPGGSVTLEFTITNPNPTEAMTDVSFTDDLSAAYPGLVATGLPASDICGAGSLLSGSGVITLTDGTLPGGSACTFQVTLDLPLGVAPAGTVTNTTSSITGVVGGTTFTGPVATDELLIDYLQFSKAFRAPVQPGGIARLTFTIVNPDPTSAVTGISFSDDLGAMLPGAVVAAGTPATGVCGFASTLTGTSVIVLSQGSLSPGATCTFSVDVQIPDGAADGTYINVTSPLSSGGVPAASPADAPLVINSAATVADIPTLGVWMLMLMAALLAGVAILRP